MNNNWETLVDCLRNEMQEYGALLALFDGQQENILQRDPEKILTTTSAIEEQARRLNEVRQVREEQAFAFASAHGRPAGTTLRELATLAAAEVRPLLEALIGEINHLIHRSRRKAEQNQRLLARAIEVQQEILQALRPGSFNKTYSPRGRVALSTPSFNPAYKGAG